MNGHLVSYEKGGTKRRDTSCCHDADVISQFTFKCSGFERVDSSSSWGTFVDVRINEVQGDSSGG